MFEALTHSDLSAIHDLAVARSRLEGHFARAPSIGERDALTARIFARILSLPADAQVELCALVRLGCDATEDADGEHRARARDWRALLAAARTSGAACTPHQIAVRVTLDECIERGLLVLGGRVA